MQNYEANVLVSEQKLVRQLLDYFEEHFSGAHAKRITEEWLRGYRQVWLERQKVVNRLRAARSKVRRIGTKAETEQSPPRRIRGHVFAFTGRIADWPRETKLYPRVKRLGGQIAPYADGMGQAHCLVHADILGGRKSTRKLLRARELSLPVITEEEFFVIMERERRQRKS
jgi:hypothetical protein